MKILIIGTARSGTTTLTNAIGKSLGLTTIIEPFHPNALYNLYNPIQTNIVLKTLIQHKNFNELIELTNSFDKTILLSRRDRIAAWESECNGKFAKDVIVSRNGYYDGFEEWHRTYVHNPLALDITHIPLVDDNSNSIIEFHKIIKTPIIWYEDLYSNDYELSKTTFENMELGVKYSDVYDYMNPSKKYRKESSILI